VSYRAGNNLPIQCGAGYSYMYAKEKLMNLIIQRTKGSIPTFEPLKMSLQIHKNLSNISNCRFNWVLEQEKPVIDSNSQSHSRVIHILNNEFVYDLILRFIYTGVQKFVSKCLFLDLIKFLTNLI
jgi:hypothetical protein